jgi:hypothetical protein
MGWLDRNVRFPEACFEENESLKEELSLVEEIAIKEEASLDDAPYRAAQELVREIVEKVIKAGYDLGKKREEVLRAYLVKALETDKIVPFFVFYDHYAYAGPKAAEDFVFGVRET